MQTLFDLGPTSRAELARMSGAKRTTISGIVQPLIDAGLLVEGEPGQSRGVGKPARPLWFSPDASPVCAITLMPGRVRTAMVSLQGEIYGLQTEEIGPDADQTRYIDAVERSASASMSVARGRALGIGVAVDGMVDPGSGSIMAMNRAPSLTGLRLPHHLERRFGVAVAIDHLPRAILMGERWFGTGRRLRNFAVVYADEGLACSLFMDGRPFRGPYGSGGELGHTIVSVHGEACICGRKGCWETVASLRWLRSRAQALGVLDAEKLGVADLCAAAEQDATCSAILEEYAYNLAVGIANLQTLLMPGHFILYGNVAEGSTRLLNAIRSDVGRLVPTRPGEPVRVEFGVADQLSITLRGAAGLVIAGDLDVGC